ncbi:MAG: 16S rRNA (guanine(527)-N(7))-methyltransferase RsmG [Erysipelotrichales bacterium]|nr:16S rRNA (guanine(527)-N(7))-methyltransferase RsmG [Erysipelotrichales bacterium]
MEININDYLQNFKLSEEKLMQFTTYYQWLAEWNEKINLTAITEINAVYTKHFFDSLTVSKVVELKDKTLIDIGSGAGFPGLALKIYEPTLKLTIIDGNAKKLKFIQALVDHLALTDVTLIHGRAEVEIINYRESFDIVTARAVAKLNMLTEYSLPYAKVGGFFVAMKGSNYQVELDDAKKAIKLIGGEVTGVTKFAIPYANEEHYLINIKKIKKTELAYPRSYAQIDKRPL